MNIIIYIVIFVLFSVLFLWTWNNEKSFEKTPTKIAFIAVGILVLSFITLLIFNFSKREVIYPNENMVNQIRNMVLLIFVPINGFFTLPYIASWSSDIISGKDEKSKRKLIILGIVFIIAIIFEVNYLKSFQNGIIQILNSK